MGVDGRRVWVEFEEYGRSSCVLSAPWEPGTTVTTAATSVTTAATSRKSAVATTVAPGTVAAAASATVTASGTVSGITTVAGGPSVIDSTFLGQLTVGWGRLTVAKKAMVTAALVATVGGCVQIVSGCIDIVHKLTGPRASGLGTQEVAPTPPSSPDCHPPAVKPGRPLPRTTTL